MVESRRIYLDEDTRLMIKVSEGDKEAYTILYNKHFSAVVSFVASFNSQLKSTEDIAQEVFCRIWKKREEYHPIAAFKTYLFGYAKKVLSEYLKSQNKEAIIRKSQFSEYSACFSNQTLEYKFKADKTEIIEAVQKAQFQLTVKQIESVELHHYVNLTVNKAAKVAKCTEKAFEKRLSRAHKHLREILADFKP